MSSNVSSVAGILAPGQTGNVNTGSKEDDLKIQFAQVMSQMTTQVGAGSYSGNNNTRGGKTDKAADVAAPTESYEQYQYRDNGIKEQQGALEQVEGSQVQEQLDSYETEVKEVLQEELGVTEEQIEAAMEQLGLTAIDLMNPQQLANLVAELTGCQDAGELLCNSEFLDVLKEVGVLTEGLLKELGLTGEELKQAYEMLQGQAETIIPETVADTEIEPEMAEAVVTTEPVVDETASQTIEVQLTEEKQPVAERQQADETKVQEDVVTDKTAKETVAAAEERQTGEAVEEKEYAAEEETATDDLAVKKTETSREQQTGSSLNQQNQQSQQSHANGAANVQVNNNSQQQPVSAAVTETVPEFARQLDTESIIRQIVEYTKINISNTQTTMEMQLNPENLGKIYLEVTAKQGNVSAHIVAQNEFVKEALEAQMVELKQNMNQAGVKVDAVEVTVGSHEFERNLEQNEKQEEHQAEEREKASGKIRRLNLSELDELTGVMSEEEALVAQMMADQGNSIDYTA